MTTSEAFLNYLSCLRQDTDIPAWSGYMPGKDLGAVGNFFDLHPVMRALLIADGTVTTAIEAIYREPVSVDVEQQEMLSISVPIPLLEIGAGEEAFYRRVKLTGGTSGKVYVQAYSLLKQRSLPAQLWRQLQNEEVGMGVVLRSAAQSSYRRVLNMGSGDLMGLDEGFVHRTYSVNIAEQTAILITEVFNLDMFASGYN